MSATSEELAAQSEQLQASIAYFRVEAASGGSAPQRRPIARPAAKLATKLASTTSKPIKLASAKPARNGRANGHANGFALNLANGAGDAHDAEFEKY